MHSDLLFSVVLCGERTKVRRKIMKCKMTGAAGLAGAVVAGVVGAAAVGGGMAAAGGKTGGGVARDQEVIVERVINPTITEEDITLLRQDLRAKKMQVIGQ